VQKYLLNFIFLYIGSSLSISDLFVCLFFPISLFVFQKLNLPERSVLSVPPTINFAR
jgi:hypothetical protein